MKKFFAMFFITLGVIFSIILLVLIYLLVFDPFNIKPLLFGNENKYVATEESNTNNATGTENTSKRFLSESQKQTLSNFGIDPSSLPSSITPAQEACFKEKLGSARFAEISAGASPSAMEFLSAKACL